MELKVPQIVDTAIIYRVLDLNCETLTYGHEVLDRLTSAERNAASTIEKREKLKVEFRKARSK